MLLHILVHTCMSLSFCVLLYIIASFCNIGAVFLYIIVFYCVFISFLQKSARIMGLEGFMCFEASLPSGLRKQRGVGGAQPPPPPPICKHNACIIGLERIFICFEASLPGFKKQRGVSRGGRRPPPIGKHNDGFGRDSYALKKLARRQTNNKYVLCIMNSTSNSSKYIHICFVVSIFVYFL